MVSQNESQCPPDSYLSKKSKVRAEAREKVMVCGTFSLEERVRHSH